MSNADWLGQLHPFDRQQAIRWLKQVGEARFQNIAIAATMSKRAAHRPKKDYRSQVRAVLIHWLTHPHLTKPQAASAVARSMIQEVGSAKHLKMSIPALVRILSDGMKDPQVGLFLEAMAEASRLGKEIRKDTGWIDPFNTLMKSFTQLQSRHASLIPTSLREPAYIQNAPKAVSEKALLSLSSSKDNERMDRIGHVVEALHGLVDPHLPITRVTELFDSMVEILNQERS